MVRHSMGPRRRTRNKLRKHVRARGLSPITRAFQQFEPGEKASIIIDPSVHKGQPNHRFHGLTGEVLYQRGRAYILAVKVGNKMKEVIVLPEHLRKVNH